jgi:hypothetical protein
VAIGLAALVLVGQPATAFYWYGWPGSGELPRPLIPRPSLPKSEEPLPKPPTPLPPDTPVTPREVPEPGTLLAAAVGLAAAGAARRWTRKAARD